jgi:esterase/lipase superfamily enzyme
VQIIEASVRRNFTSTLRLGPMRFRLLGLGLGELSLAEVLRRTSGKRVLILIHGYRVGYENGLDAYQQIAGMVQTHGIEYDVVLFFFWPGSFLFLGFLAAGGRANQAGDALGFLLTDLRRSDVVIDIETHSLGARVACRALAKQGSIRLLILTAPAIQDHAFESLEEFWAIPYATKAVHVCHSRTDEALKTFRITSWWHRAMGLLGPRKAGGYNVAAHDFTVDCPDHGDYKRSPRLYGDWKRWTT